MARERRLKQASGAGTEGSLAARPQAANPESPPGLRALGLGGRRDGMLYVPATYRHGEPAPFALMLHGAGGQARHGLDLLLPHAEAAGMILLAPDSRDRTWDVILGGYGQDVAFIDRALTQTFGRYSIDPAHLAIGGFSDGASYALSLGLSNGDLFTHVLAFSPGFMAPARQEGAPRVFISHGTRDEVLPIEVCSRRLVPRLRGAGYDLRYEEFDGPHTVPIAIVEQALTWMLPSNP